MTPSPLFSVRCSSFSSDITPGAPGAAFPPGSLSHQPCPVAHPFRGEGVAHPERTPPSRFHQACHPERSDPAFSYAPLFGAPGRAERDPSTSFYREGERAVAPGAAVAPGFLGLSWVLRLFQLSTFNSQLPSRFLISALWSLISLNSRQYFCDLPIVPSITIAPHFP
jgi:hypothetical protein